MISTVFGWIAMSDMVRHGVRCAAVVGVVCWLLLLRLCVCRLVSAHARSLYFHRGPIEDDEAPSLLPKEGVRVSALVPFPVLVLERNPRL